MKKRFIPIWLVLMLLSQVLAGCVHKSANAPSLDVHFTVDEKGMTFTSSDANLSLTFPAGSVTSKSNLAVKNAVDLPADSKTVPGTAYTFGPDGTLFQKPVQLSIKYDPGKLPSGIPEKSLCLAKLIGGSWQRILSSKVDTDARAVNGPIGGFSTYGLIGSDMSVSLDSSTMSVVQDDEVKMIPLLKNAPNGYEFTYQWKLGTGKYGDLFIYDRSGVLTKYGNSGTSLLTDGSVSFKAYTDAPVGSTDTLTLSIISKFFDADKVETDYVWLQADFPITIQSKVKQFWILSGSEDPMTDVVYTEESPVFRLNGKPVYRRENHNTFEFSANPGDILDVTVDHYPSTGDHFSIGALWLHLWDGAKKVKLADPADLGTWNEPSSTKPVNIYKTSYKIPNLKANPAEELANDDGTAEGGMSLGGINRYGFHVGFTPDKYYKIDKIKIFSWLKVEPQADSQFTVWLGDSKTGIRWSVLLPFSEFTRERSWLEVDVPGTVVDGNFWVQVYAPSYAQGTGPYIGVDESGPNIHTEIISHSSVVDWNLQIPHEQANWMIRVEGQPVSTLLYGNWNSQQTLTGDTGTQLTLTGWSETSKEIGKEPSKFGEGIQLVAALTSSGKPLDGKTVQFEQFVDGKWKSLDKEISAFDTVRESTPPSGDGRAHFLTWSGRKSPYMPLPGKYQFRATFAGDATYGKSEAYFDINVNTWATIELATDTDALSSDARDVTSYMAWDAGLTLMGQVHGTDNNPIAGAPLSIRYSDSQGQNWQPLPGGEVTTGADGKFKITFGGGPTPVFPRQGLYLVKATFAGGDYDGITYKYAESPVKIDVTPADLGIQIKPFNLNPVSFEELAVTVTLVPHYGIPVTGPVEVILYSEPGGTELAKYSGAYPDPIIFRIKMISGNYELHAAFQRNANYSYINSDRVSIRVGN